MGTTVNIDTGGTFTDGYFTRAEQVARVKVDTTPHDLTECLAQCVREGASRLGYPSVQALLLDCDVFRFSSTIGTNSIIQRTGPRIGLLVSPGAKDALYGSGESPLYEFFLRKDLVAEIADPLDSEKVLRLVNELLIRGARILVVSLENSERDPSEEQTIKNVVRREYPRHYLGAVPCLLASDITPRPGAERRAATAVVNAYLHPDMVTTLYKADEDLRSHGYPHPLLIAHSSGGVARVAKTRAIDTYNSGPVGGVYGSARISETYGIQNAVVMDIGGTSTDITVLTGGSIPFDDNPTIAGIPVHTPMVKVRAIGGGGGSIVRRTASGYTIGPDSMGASPGPACYGLGGSQATATDAEVVLGNIDPDWFLGGRRRLDDGRARSAIEQVAGEEAVEDAAWEIHRELVSLVAEEIQRVITPLGVPPGDFRLFAFGGGAGLFAAEVAERCGIGEIYSFDAASVFSAFGIAGMDVSHVYELPRNSSTRETLEILRNRAELDASGEGFDPSALTFAAEVEDLAGVKTHRINDDWDAAAAVLNGREGAARLRATVALDHAPIVSRGAARGNPPKATKGKRQIYHAGEAHSHATVYDRDLIDLDAEITGPALIESVDTTLLVPPGHRCKMDQFGTIIIRREG